MRTRIHIELRLQHPQCAEPVSEGERSTGDGGTDTNVSEDWSALAHRLCSCTIERSLREETERVPRCETMAFDCGDLHFEMDPWGFVEYAALVLGSELDGDAGFSYGVLG